MDTKAQLIEKAEHYFKDEKVKLMYATSDGNFFYELGKNYADSHAKTKKLELFTIIRADLVEAKPKAKSKEVKKEKPETDEANELIELRKEAKKLKIRGFGIMKAETLKRKIAENK